MLQLVIWCTRLAQDDQGLGQTSYELPEWKKWEAWARIILWTWASEYFEPFNCAFFCPLVLAELTTFYIEDNKSESLRVRKIFCAIAGCISANPFPTDRSRWSRSKSSESHFQFSSCGMSFFKPSTTIRWGKHGTTTLLPRYQHQIYRTSMKKSMGPRENRGTTGVGV